MPKNPASTSTGSRPTESMRFDPALQGSIHHVLHTAFKDIYAAQRRHSPPQSGKDHAWNQELPSGAGDLVDGFEKSAEGTFIGSSTIDHHDQEQRPEVDGHLDEASRTQLQQLDTQLVHSQSEAEGILAYLTEQQKVAAEEDEQDGDELKRKGLIINAHIPIGPSHLNIDPQVLQSYGKHGEHLLSAHDIVMANRDTLLRRSGRLPVADGLKTYNLDELMYVEPHYQKITKSSTVRQAIVLTTSTAPHGEYAPQRAEGEPTVKTKPHRPRAKYYKADQLTRDSSISKAMAHKLHFKRNPRYDKTDRAYNRSLVAQTAPNGLAKLNCENPAHFSVSASPLVFREFEVGQSYQLPLSIRNVTAVKRTFRLLPPSTSYFTIVGLDFPLPGNRELAPGIAAVVYIRFIPDALSDYHDQIIVVSEAGDIVVPLLARRLHANLTLPAVIDVGMCLTGAHIHTKISVKNEGGRGRFRLLHEEDYPVPKAAQRLLRTIKVPPFKVWPVAFELGRGESIALHVSCVPATQGKHTASMLLLSDDCTLRHIELRAETSSVRLEVCEWNGIPVSYDALSHPEHTHMDFGTVSIGDAAVRTLKVHNPTATELSFTWHWTTDVPAYHVKPAEGSIEAMGTAEFRFMYQSQHIGKEAGEVVLVFHSVPPTSMPLPGQEELLEKLADAGRRGTFRLDNWLRAALLNGGDALSRAELEQGLLERTLNGPFMYELIETLDRLYPTDTETVPVQEILASLSTHVKAAIEDHLEAEGVYTEEPEPKVDVTCLSLRLTGSGEALELRVEPSSRLELEGAAYPGKEYVLEAELVNCSDTAVMFAWLPARQLIDHDSTHLNTCESDADQASIKVEPPEGSISHGGRVHIKVSLTPRRTGQLLLRIACRVTGMPAEAGPHIIVHANVIPPYIRFLEPEIDFGLLSVGGKVSRAVSFMNESHIPVEWSLSQDMLGLITEAIGDGFFGLTTMSSMGSSRLSSARSMGSAASQTVTEDSMNIKSLESTVSFEPSVGQLKPGEVAVVTIALEGGKASERLRGRLQCEVNDLTGLNDPSFQSITYRGEVQELKVFFDQLRLDLGVVYANVPVKRRVIMTNASNLTTTFRFEKPWEGSKAFVTTINPERGELHEKQSIEVEVTFLATAPGASEELFGCRVYGMNHPLGFQLKAVAKGVVVSYELLGEQQSVPRALAPPSEPQLPAGVMLPTADTPPTLQFGTVPLFARKKLRFIIRNLSAVPAAFSIRPKKLPAVHGPIRKRNLVLKEEPDTPPTASTEALTTAGSHSTGTVDLTFTHSLMDSQAMTTVLPRREGLVDESHERMDRFNSAAGREYLTAKYAAEEDRAILSLGNGAAFDVQPAQGFLVPWGVTEVVVTAYNNMGGKYADVLACNVTGAPVSTLNVQMAVSGCPLSLRKDVVGLDMVTGTLPTLHLGEVCLGDNPRTKVITLKNSGPLDAVVTWKILEATSKTNMLPSCALKIDILPEGEGAPRRPIKVTLVPEQYRPNPVWSVSPLKAKVKGFHDIAFTVTMTCPESLGPTACRLVADAEWHYPAGRKARAGADRRTPSCVKLLAEGTVIHPRLALDKRKHGEDGDKQHLKFEVSSQEAKSVARWGAKTGPLPASMHRSFALSNPTTVPLTFKLDACKPFKILGVTMLGHKSRGPPLPPSSVTDGEPSYTLGPQESLDVNLAFIPSREKRSSADTTTKSPDASQLKQETVGNLSIHFSTGQLQDIVLHGVILRPLVIVAPAEHSFGPVHVDTTVTITLFLSNPTMVTAAWTLEHIPAPPRKPVVPKPWAPVEPPTPTDDPSLFSFSERCGTQQGPSLPLPSSGATAPHDCNRSPDAVFEPLKSTVSWKDQLTTADKWRRDNEEVPAHRYSRPVEVSFTPRIAGLYRSRFIFLVDAGEAFDVVFQGEGTYAEDVVPKPPAHV